MVGGKGLFSAIEKHPTLFRSPSVSYEVDSNLEHYLRSDVTVTLICSSAQPAIPFHDNDRRISDLLSSRLVTQVIKCH